MQMKIILAVVIIAVILAVIALAVVYTKEEKYVTPVVTPVMGFSILCDPKTMTMLNNCGLQDGLTLSMELASFTQANFGYMTFHGVFELPQPEKPTAKAATTTQELFNCVFLTADNNMDNVKTIDFLVEPCTFQGFCTALFNNQQVANFLQSLRH